MSNHRVINFTAHWPGTDIKWEAPYTNQPCHICGILTGGLLTHFTVKRSKVNAPTCQPCAIKIFNEAMAEEQRHD
jgi:hypothetical protein